MKRTVYIFGHKNPDTDSICSAIAYAYLKNQLERKVNHLPMRLGEINLETRYVLTRFGFQVPELLKNVRTQVSDIGLKTVPLFAPTISLQEAWEHLKAYETHTLPLSEDNKKLAGLITVGGIAEAYMASGDPEAFKLSETPLENLLYVLRAELLTEPFCKKQISGRVLVGAMDPEYIGAMVKPGDLMIVGNRPRSQKAAIDKGAALLVITGGADLDDDILQEATVKRCTVVRSPFDTFAVSRAIYNALPVAHFMKSQNITYFELDDELEDVHQVMTQKRFRNFPVYDDQHHYVGMISRMQLLKPDRKQVILVDHNEQSQSVEGIKEAEVLEIIDHHRIGGFQTNAPVYFRNLPVGSTATIVTALFREKQIGIPCDVAALLCSAILSDTLLFKSPTCTPMDMEAAVSLAELAGLHCETLGREMFKAGSDLLTMTPREIFNQDLKVFQTGKVQIAVGQVSALDETVLAQVAPLLRAELSAAQAAGGYDLVLLMLTDISAESTTLLSAGPSENLLEKAFGKNAVEGAMQVQGLVSRKKQLIPALLQAIESDISV